MDELESAVLHNRRSGLAEVNSYAIEIVQVPSCHGTLCNAIQLNTAHAKKRGRYSVGGASIGYRPAFGRGTRKSTSSTFDVARSFSWPAKISRIVSVARGRGRTVTENSPHLRKKTC
jgi:hypothetical protein